MVEDHGQTCVQAQRSRSTSCTTTSWLPPVPERPPQGGRLLFELINERLSVLMAGGIGITAATVVLMPGAMESCAIRAASGPLPRRAADESSHSAL